MRTFRRHLVELARRHTTYASPATNIDNDIAHNLTQTHIGQKILDGYFVVLTADLNDSPDTLLSCVHDCESVDKPTTCGLWL
jgi:hypothetical protein